MPAVTKSLPADAQASRGRQPETGTPVAQQDRRAAPRRRLVTPVWIQEPDEHGPGRAHGYELNDVSDSGLSFTSHKAFTPGQHVLVELSANNHRWSGEMRVAHCTPAMAGFTVGLGVVSTSAASDPSAAPSQEEDRRASLAELRADVERAMRAYQLAQRTWGLLGRSFERRIRRITARLRPAPSCEEVENRRQGGRFALDDDVCLVVNRYGRWRIMRGSILDVSEGGVGLRIPLRRQEDHIERMFTGQFETHTQMSVIVGLGARPNTFWAPARVAWARLDGEWVLQMGIQFDAAAAASVLEECA